MRSDKSIVSLIKCTDYSSSNLKDSILSALKKSDIKLSIFKNKIVALKPNLLSATPVEKAVLTNPDFFRAIVQIVKENGGKPVLVESPAFQPLAKVMEKTGYNIITAEEKIEIADINKTEVLHYDNAEIYKSFEIIKRIHEADVIVNIPKFKTHNLTYITGAVKNFFGLIPGLKKAQQHIKAPDRERFATLLLDMYSAINFGFKKPKEIINIMDAIIGMEGEGPGATGTPKHIGAILASRDAIALDFVAVNLVKLDAGKVLTITSGAERKLGNASFDKISITGNSLDDFNVVDFKPIKYSNQSSFTQTLLQNKLLKKLLIEKPVPVKNICKLCYECEKICPAKAITKGNKKVPLYNYNKCVRCFCCMEICSYAAIRREKGKLQWLLDIFV